MVEEVLDAINARLVARWPDRTVYIDVCPVDFARPSFWLAMEENAQTDANRAYIRRTLRLKITIFDELDEHYEASWLRLARETEAVMKLLTPPLAAGGRRIALALKALPRDPDRAYVQLEGSWLEPRPELEGETDAPAADRYAIRVVSIHTPN